MSDLLEKTDLDKKTTDDQDRDKFSHYVDKNEILESAFNGVPAVAICGKVWFPSSDPTKYGVCPECAEIYKGMKD